MARPQKKGGPKQSMKKKSGFGKKTAQDEFVNKALSRDVFEAAEESDRRKGHDLDEVDNLEYDAGEIDEEDDEEIDSDEAFDESDEERFEGYKFLGSTKVNLFKFDLISMALNISFFLVLREKEGT